MSALGSGVDQNQYLIDGMNVTAPTSGVARADPGIDFIQEVQIQSVGVPAEFGNVQGAVVKLITRSGSNLFLFDASYLLADRRPDQPADTTHVRPRRSTGERIRAREVP